MKKTLAALAVLGAFAGTSMAADVTLYGVIDTGFVYGAKDTGVVGTDTVHNFTMNQGTNSANRFGLKGEEDLGNGLKVGFVLENGFKSDDGALGSAGRLFDRESNLYVNGAFGEIGVGRQGQLMSGNGRYGLFGGAVSPVSTGWGDYLPGHKFVMAGDFGRIDNAITYKSPKFAGFNVLAQYSLKKDSTVTAGTEGKNTSEREWALGVSFAQGPATASLVVNQYDKAVTPGHTTDPDDPLMVALGGAYDFGVAKAFVATQYFKDAALNKSALNYKAEVKNADGVVTERQYGEKFDKADGFGVQLGVTAPVGNGVVKALVGYLSAEQQVTGDKPELDRYTATVGYEYNLSKRTFVYTGVGYYQDSYKNCGDDADAKTYGATLGLVHKF